jgi:outer membrane protein assembly factor BamB
MLLGATVALGQGQHVWVQGYDAQQTSVSPFEFSPPFALMWQFSSDEAISESKRTPTAAAPGGMLGAGPGMGMPGMPGMEGMPPGGMPGMEGMPGAMPGTGPAGVATTTLPKPVASPVVASDRVFFAIGSNVYCLDRVTGAQLWKRSVGGRVYGTPAYASGYLYVAEDNGGIHALNADRGSEEWVFRLDKGVRTPLLYVEGVLYMGCEDGRVYALDTNARDLKWVYSTGGKVRAGVAVWRETVYAASQDGYLYAVSTDGKQRWRVNLGDKTCYVPPVVRNEKVYVAAGSKLMAFDAQLGHKRWEFNTPKLITGPLAVTGEAVFCGSAEGAIYCLDQAIGAPRWRYPREGNVKPVQSGIFVGAGKVLVRAGTASVLTIDATTGELIWSYNLPKPPERAKRSGPGMPGGLGPEGMGGLPGGGAPGAALGVPGGGAGPGGQPIGYSFIPEMEDVVDPSVALADNRLYILGDDCVLYGLEADAADAVPPVIEDAVLEIQGEGKMMFAYGVPIDDADQFPMRFADLVKVPGSPPVYLSIRVVDYGCGVDPGSVELTMDGKKLDTTYDSEAGLLWYIHQAKGRGAVALPNGQHNFVVRAADWRGNRGSAQLSLTIDNSMSPPKVAHPQVGAEGGMPGALGPGMGPGMMGPPGGMPGMPPMP